MRTHTFIVEVRTVGNRRAAEMKLISAWAARRPDNSEFSISSGGKLDRIRQVMDEPPDIDPTFDYAHEPRSPKPC